MKKKQKGKVVNRRKKEKGKNVGKNNKEDVMEIKEVIIQQLYSNAPSQKVLAKKVDEKLISRVKQKHKKGEVLPIICDRSSDYVFGGYDVMIAARKAGIKKARVYQIDVSGSKRILCENFLNVIKGELELKHYRIAAIIVKDLSEDDKYFCRFDYEEIVDWVWMKAHEYFDNFELVKRKLKMSNKTIEAKIMEIKGKIKILRNCHMGHLRWLLVHHLERKVHDIIVNRFTDNILDGYEEFNLLRMLGIKKIRVKSISVMPHKEMFYKSLISESGKEFTDNMYEAAAHIVNAIPIKSIDMCHVTDEKVQLHMKKYVKDTKEKIKRMEEEENEDEHKKNTDR